MVKTTKIEKKYKDKKTGEYKSITINHAKVADRLMEFWKDNPTGEIKTIPTKDVNGQVIFEAVISTERGSATARQATGHSFGSTDGEKNLEKLETIAVGRALAMLGYATSGEVASQEEMDEFNKFKIEKHERLVNETIIAMQKAQTLAELRKVWKSSPVMADKDVISEKDALKGKFSTK